MITYKNPVYMMPDKSQVKLTMVNDDPNFEFSGLELSCVCSKNSFEQELADLYQQTIKGDFGKIEPFIEIPRFENTYTYKTEIWARCTDEEAEHLDEYLKAAPIKKRRMWEDANVIDHNSEYFTELKSVMESVFGVNRTKLILAGSDE